jgi:hypothetical protein
MTLITEQHLFYQHVCGAYWHDATSIQTMQLQFAGYHLGGHFGISSCTSTAATESN